MPDAGAGWGIAGAGWGVALVGIVIAYVVGATPFGFLAAKLKGVDIRQHGSGNIGATNVMRTLGKGVGIPVFLLDVLKGFVPTYFAARLSGDSNPDQGILAAAFPIGVALAAILGHSFTFWLGFKGGKGVATSAGALLALIPVALAGALALWLVLFFTTRYVAVASIAAALVLPVIVGFRAAVGGRIDVPALVLALVIAALVIVRHRSNIRRLLDGTENRFERRKPKPEVPS
ncbi:glycerol-3-phosphate 1-O-acyltransferase PlsY [soil metagenome]